MLHNRLLLALLLWGFSRSIFAQTTADYTVQVSAVSQSAPPVVTFTWPASATATSYTVYRKLKTQPLWTLVTNLPGTANTYTENNMVIGDTYEYRFDKTEPTYSGYGFIYAGIEAPVIESRGKAIVVVDTTILTGMQVEFHRFLRDLAGDGYEVIRVDVDRNDAVMTVKNQIVTIYNLDTATTKTLILFGRVPVPYSGNLAPDAHIPDHEGAWPADVFYGDIDGTWTDNTVNTTAATRTENHNILGDNKWDQSILPSDVELMLGRIDLSNMGNFALSEADLLKQYLKHNHEFRHMHFVPQMRALIDDNFGAFSGEAFAANGFRNFSALAGFSNVSAGNYFPDLVSQDYLFSYGCGAGSYTSSSGVGNTGNFVSDTVRTVITSLFGSYFGDWDSNNNFLRAPLASGRALVSFWAGRPHWQIHHMSMGEPIGYGTRLSQNNQNVYFAGAFPRRIHIALMGDPSLRMKYVQPPSNIALTPQNNQNELLISWNAAAAPVNGYHIYASTNELGPYARVNPTLITGTTYTDTMPAAGLNWYMVRAVKLDTTAGGTFYNISQGVMDSIQLIPSIQTTTVSPMAVCPGDSVDIDFTITGPFWWNNNYTAELSDNTGSFASPIALGTLSGKTPQTLRVAIPVGTVAGTQYRFRITGNQPMLITGSDNGSDFTVEVSPAAPAVGNNGPLCPGDQLQLSTTVSGIAFEWQGPNGYSSTQQNPQINNINSTHAGVYTLIYKTGLCFSAPGTTNVLFNVPVSTTANSNSPICAGAQLQMSAAVFGTATYQWTGPGGQNLSGQTPVIPTAFMPDSGSWILLVLSNGCMLASDTFQVVIHGLPLSPTITWNGTQLNSSEVSGNQWHLNGTAIPGATNQSHTPAQSGAYHVVFTDGNGCSSSSGAEVIYMTGTESDLLQGGSLSIYPNPASTSLFLYDTKGLESDIRIVLRDIQGREIVCQMERISAETIMLDVSGVGSGYYVLEVLGTGYPVLIHKP
jgi:hypothetical protein